MTPADFDKILDTQFAECQSILRSKGTDYTDGNDRFSNFKVVADLVGSTPEMVWAIYWLKHVFAVAAFCGRGKVESEPIEGRISDAINYLLLLRGMVEEKKVVAT